MGLINNYYSSDDIREYGAHYNLIYSGRSNGKTYDLLSLILKNHIKSGYKEQGAIIRRWREDLRPARADQFFAGHVENGLVKKLTGGAYDNIKQRSGKFYLCKYDPNADKYAWAAEPFCHSFGLSNMEHDKSTSYPRVKTIVFDEFLSRAFYLADEFGLFLNVLSTIVRDRKDWTLYMLGNTVSKFSPYFQAFDIDIKALNIGDIKKFTTPTGIDIAVEYAPMREQEPGEVSLLDLGTTESRMITHGDWETGDWPIISKPQVKRTHFIYLEILGVILECSLYTYKDIYLYVQPAYKIKDSVYIISTTPKVGKYNLSSFRHVSPSMDKLLQTYAKAIATRKVFFDSNDTGEVMLNFLSQLQQQNVMHT